MSALWGGLALVEPHSMGCPRVRLCQKRVVLSREIKTKGRVRARQDLLATRPFTAASFPPFNSSPQVRWQSNQHKQCHRLQLLRAATSPSLPPESGSKSIASSLQSSIFKFSKLWRRFLPMCVLFFGMAFINTIVNSLALTLVVTSHGGGAQVLPYLTVYAALPSSVIFIVLYTYALQRMERRHVFTVIVSLFAVFNLVFGLALYPNHETLHLHSLADQVLKVLPPGLSGAVGMVRNWTFTLFYCMSELWGDVGLSLLFWGLANETTRLEDAAVLYPLFGFGANIAQMAAGMVLRASSSGDAGFMSSFQKLIFLLFGCKAAVIVLHEWIMSQRSPMAYGHKATNLRHQQYGSNADGRLGKKEARYMNGQSPQKPEKKRQRARSKWHDFDTNQETGQGLNSMAVNAGGADSPQNTSNHEPQKGRKNKQPSFIGAMRILSQTPQIRSLAVITVSQCLAVNLMEFVWKSQLRMAYPSPGAFTSFMGDVSTATGLLTCCLMLISPILFDRLSWGQVAGLTPKLLYYGGIAFFASGIGHQVFSKLGMLGISQFLLPVAIIGGAVLYVVARGVKFSLFKPAEEMVYITLDEDSRTKGKAAIDVVGAQLGKSGGSLLQQLLLLGSGGALIGITPAIFAVYLVMLHSWQKGIDTLEATQMIETEGKSQVASNVANLENMPKFEFPGNRQSDDENNRQYVEFHHSPRRHHLT